MIFIVKMPHYGYISDDI